MSFCRERPQPAAIAAATLELVDERGEARARQVAALQEVVERLGGGGAAERAAEAILPLLN